MKPASKNTSSKTIKATLMWAVLMVELGLPFLLYIGLQNQMTWLVILSGGLLLMGLIFLIIIR
ncbi:MAG: hypothetical protein MUO40_03790 [Anaerolineaceae bacterium]|nr:hypothetical protein [Anaerolineaceae bacterium]